MAALHTHYDTLQVSANASPEVVRGAYRYLSQKWHPDKNPERREQAEDMMVRLNEAYAVLSDPQRRRDYDAWLSSERAAQAATAENARAGGPSVDTPDAEGSALRAHYAAQIAKGWEAWLYPLIFFTGLALAVWLAQFVSWLRNHPILAVIFLIGLSSYITSRIIERRRGHLLKEHETRMLEQLYTEHMRRKTVRQIVTGVSGVVLAAGAIAYFVLDPDASREPAQAGNAGGPPAKVLARLRVENACDRDLRIAVHYLPHEATWRTEGWWHVKARAVTGLRGDLGAIESSNPIFYYYAETLDRRSVWRGSPESVDDATLTLEGHTMRFQAIRLERDGNGEYPLRLTC